MFSLSHYLMKEQREKVQDKCDQRRHSLDNAFKLDHMNSIRDKEGLCKTVLEYSYELLATFLVDKIIFDTFLCVFLSSCF